MKKVNLIERLLSYSHEKQSPQRFGRYAVMLIMLLTLGVGQMWGYTIIRNGCLVGEADGTWSTSDEMTEVSTNVYSITYDSPTATTDLKFRIGKDKNWNTEKDAEGIDNLNSNIVMLSNGDGDKNIKFQVPTSVPVTIYYNSSTKKIWIKVESYKTDVLNGKEMFYYGYAASWGGNFAHFYDNGTRKFGNYAANSYSDNTANLAIGVYDVSGSTNYSASHSDSWSGVNHEGMAAGCQIQTYSVSSTNYCYYNDADQFSFGPTSYTIVVGQTIASFPSISLTSKQSGADADLSLEGYYYSTATSGQAWNVFTPGTTESSLAAGTYYIKAIATDGAIYMASTNYITLTVNSAPVLGVANATSVTSNSATFNATATLNSNTTSSYGFKYGAGASYDTKAELISGGTSASTSGALDASTFSKNVTGLSASTTYYYISYVVINGTTYYSDAVKSFTTSAAATYNLSVEAGTGISAVTGSTNNISANQSIAITATVATGYTWSTWTKTAGSGTLSTFTAGTKDQTVKVGTVGNITLTASATENMSSLTTSNSYNVGNPSYAIPTKSVSSIGIATTSTLTATTAGTGYTFAGWTLSSNLVVVSGNAATDRTIIVRTNGNGADATAQANYTEDLTTTWYIAGDGNGTGTNLTPGSPFSGWGTSGTRMSKKTGHSTEEIYYCTITVSTVATTDDHFPFKVYNSTGTQYYGNNGYWVTKENNHPTLSSTSGSNMKFRPYVTGTYEFKLDNTGANPVLTVTWPVYNQVRISAASASDATNTGNFDLSEPVSNVRTVTRSLKTNTTYTFKIMSNSDWYGYTSGTFTRSNSTSSNSLTTSKDGGNMTLTTDYAGSYTFKFNESTKALSIDFPEAYQVHYGVATIGEGDGNSAAITTSVVDNNYYLNGSSVSFTAAAPKTGYTFKGWYNDATGTGAKVTDTDSDGDEKTLTTTVSSSNNQFYAVYEETLHDEPVNVADYSTDVKGGTVSPTSVQAGIATAPEVTATIANNAWHFRYWSLYKVTQKEGETTGTNPTHINATEDGGNLTAYFLPRYVLQGSSHDGKTSGMPDFTTASKWDDRTADFVVNSFTNNVSDGKRQVELVCTRTLEPNTRYKFEIFDRTSGKTMGHGSGSDDIGSNNWAMNEQDRTVYFNTVGRGTYTFTITHLSEDANNYPYVQISAPTSYQLTLGCKYADVDAGLHDGTTGGTVSATATEGGSTATIANGNYIVSGGSIAFTSSPASGYTLGGWYKDAACTNAYTNGSDNATIEGNVLTISSIGASVPVYAKFVETATDVTLANNTHGHVEVSGATVTSTKTGITTSKTITAVPQDAAWHFLNWTVPDGVTRVSGALTDETITIKTITSGKTVTANFEPRYELRGSLNNTDPGNEAGMPGWSTGAPFSGTVTSLGTADGVNLTCTRTLNPNSNYKFVIHDRELNRNMGYNPMYTDIGSSSLVLDDENLDVVFWTAGRGNYTFNITCISNDDNRYPTVKLNRPASYILNLGWGYSQDGGSTFTNGSVGGNATATATESGTTVAITNGQYVISGGRIDLSAHAEDGYTFLGYYNGDGYNTRFSENANWYNENISTATTAYAKFQANAYAITFDATTNGGTLSGSNQNAIYNNTSIASCPVGVKEGYHFKGWYTASTDGELVIDASGNLQPSITVSETIWTDASSKWKKLSGATVYAQYEKAEITEITLSDAIVAPNTSITATPTISPTPTGTTGVCWELQYSNGTRVPSQPTFTPEEGNAVSFNAPAASATYILQAKLRLDDCDGEVLSTQTTTFQVAGEHTVTVHYQDASGMTLAASTEVTGKPLEWTKNGDITPPSITGYTFHHWLAGDGITLSEDGTNAKTGVRPDSSRVSNIYIKANYDGTLTAVYNKKNMIYFNNTLGWSDVYVYFYNTDKYWSGDYGSGALKEQKFDGDHQPYYEEEHGHMTQIEGTNIWYFDYEAAGYSTRANVVFTEANQHNKQWFWKTKAARRSDHVASLQMFVPLTTKTETKNETDYYSSGYWMNYPENTGYVLHVYDGTTYGQSDQLQQIPFEFTADKTLPMSINVELNAGKTYGFEIHRADGTVLGENSYTLESGNSGDEGQTVRVLGTGERSKITTTVAGDYKFTLNFGNSGGYNYLIGVHYPVTIGDYRILYTDDATWSQGAHTGNYSWWHESRTIHKENGATDIVSFYVKKDNDTQMKFQYASSINKSTGVVTWTNVPSGNIDLSSITKDSVYNFYLTQADDGISVSKIEPYTGNYYIRTDCAGATRWENFRTTDHQMTYSDYAEENSGYSHYYAHWVEQYTNIKFVIANDYSPCISDTLAADYGTTIANITAEGVEAGKLKSASANIRFMWNQSTNKISRAYIGGSSNISDRFLVLEGDTRMFNENGDTLTTTGGGKISGLNDYEMNLVDDQNFVYERTIKVNTGAKAKLTAKYNENIQYFKGGPGTTSADSVELLGGESSTTKHTMRIVYDFKTNRLMTAFVPSDTIKNAMAINADLMIVREHQEAGHQLLFNGGSLSKVHTVYGVMRFNRWTLNNKEKTGGHSVVGDPKSAYERGLYWISFPFDVKLSDVFGFGTYGTHWIIMEYDGAARATEGYWADSEGFWKYVMPSQRATYELKAGKGYVLALDLDLMKDNNSSFWNNDIEQVELFFPSADHVENIASTNVTTTVDSHECTIDRRTDKNSPDINKDRTRADSHWNIIGIPSYANYGSALKDGPTGSTIEWHTNPYTNDLPFLYEWSTVDNSYAVQSGTTYPFKAMHAYMVQYHGNLYWSLASATPPSIVARSTYAEKPESVEMRIELQQNEMKVDQTFVKLSNDENASVNFAFDEDLCKEFNANKANIYTIVENYLPVAGNTMPMSEQTTVVPVGVRIAADGDYTFSIPDGTEGIGVVLIDNIAGTRTNLGLMDYTVTLAQGQIDDRFLLEISPISQISTDVEAVTGDGLQVTGARKIMIDGLLYIVKDGVVYDAQGRRL